MSLPPHQSTEDLDSSNFNSRFSKKTCRKEKPNNRCGGLIALDFGTCKIGVAVSHGFVAEAHTTLSYDEKSPADFISSLKKIVLSQGADVLVVGLPLGKEGKPTRQGKWIEENAKMVAQALDLPIKFTDESFSSAEAKTNLGKAYSKEKIDAESAKIILDQYLNEHPNPSL